MMRGTPAGADTGTSTSPGARRPAQEEHGMATGYKIRLADGSEIGPMDREAVRGWYAQGLATRETPVLPPGAKRWITLAEAVELKDLRAPAPRVEPARPGRGPTVSPRSAPPSARPVFEEPQLWRIRLAAALFGLLAIGSILLALWPERWL